MIDTVGARDYLKSLSKQDFQSLGEGHIAYIREIDFLGEKRFVVYGADGRQISVYEDWNHALDTIETRDMEAVILQ